MIEDDIKQLDEAEVLVRNAVAEILEKGSLYIKVARGKNDFDPMGIWLTASFNGREAKISLYDISLAEHPSRFITQELESLLYAAVNG